MLGLQVHSFTLLLSLSLMGKLESRELEVPALLELVELFLTLVFSCFLVERQKNSKNVTVKEQEMYGLLELQNYETSLILVKGKVSVSSAQESHTLL